MDRNRIHAKLPGSKENLQNKSYVVFLGIGWQFHKAAEYGIFSFVQYQKVIPKND